jgi:IS5 family transposase
MGGKQIGFSDCEQSTAQHSEEAHQKGAVSNKYGGARPPYPLEITLRIQLTQKCYDLSEPAMEDALIEVQSMRRFVAIDLISDRIPEESTIISFLHRLEQHDLGKQIF